MTSAPGIFPIAIAEWMSGIDPSRAAYPAVCVGDGLYATEISSLITFPAPVTSGERGHDYQLLPDFLIVLLGAMPMMNTILATILIFAKIITHLIPADWDVFGKVGKGLKSDTDFTSLFLLWCPFLGVVLYLGYLDCKEYKTLPTSLAIPIE